MKEWDYHPTAWRELERAMTKYERERNGLGIELLAEVEDVLLTNQEHPLPGTTMTSDGRDTLRRLLLERFPYALIVDVRPERRPCSLSPTYAVAPATGERARRESR